MTDVARRAGVSVMTVSRVFRRPDSVAEETRRRVREAADAVAYVPDRVAGALKTGVSNVVAAIVPSLRNSLFGETLQGLADGLCEHGLVLTVADARYRPGEERRLVGELLSLRPRALVLHETEHEAGTLDLLARAGVLVIEVGDLAKAPIDRAVSFSNEAASLAMTRHLLSSGRRRVAFLTLPPSRSSRSRARLEGYRQALGEAGLPLDPALVVDAEGGYASGAAALAGLLDAGARPDAIFGAGDVLALGALFEARRRGVRVPDDLAIASFDDHEACRVTDPPLTALAIPRYEIGRRAARIVVEGHRRPCPTSQLVEDLGFDLVARDSTR